MTAFDFLHWCFSDADHGVWTVIMGWLFFGGVKSVVSAYRGDS